MKIVRSLQGREVQPSRSGLDLLNGACFPALKRPGYRHSVPVGTKIGEAARSHSANTRLLAPVNCRSSQLVNSDNSGSEQFVPISAVL